MNMDQISVKQNNANENYEHLFFTGKVIGIRRHKHKSPLSWTFSYGVLSLSRFFHAWLYGYFFRVLSHWGYCGPFKQRDSLLPGILEGMTSSCLCSLNAGGPSVLPKPTHPTHSKRRMLDDTSLGQELLPVVLVWGLENRLHFEFPEDRFLEF